MAPNLSAATRTLLQDLILCKLKDNSEIKYSEIAQLANCTPRAVRYARSNILHFGTIRAPSNRVGRPKKVTPTMWDAVKSQLASEPCMTQREIAVFLRREFGVTISRATIGRLIREAKWSRKITRNVAKERKQDLRDEYIHDRSDYRGEQLVVIDESGCDFRYWNPEAWICA